MVELFFGAFVHFFLRFLSCFSPRLLFVPLIPRRACAAWVTVLACLSIRLSVTTYYAKRDNKQRVHRSRHARFLIKAMPTLRTVCMRNVYHAKQLGRQIHKENQIPRKKRAAQ